jgi:CRISPR-associated protein Csb2
MMTAGPEFLVLEARFLAGTYGGMEWPPSPFRLLQAVVAGCRGTDHPGLTWLEQQPAPFVLATDEPPAVRFKRSIPNNADPRQPQAALSLRDIVHRCVTEPVRYCYRLKSADDQAGGEQAIAAAAQVHTLGTGEDMCTVRGLVAANPPESTDAIKLWLPMPGAAGSVQPSAVAWLRVPVAGSLQSLEERFQAFQKALRGRCQHRRCTAPLRIGRATKFQGRRCCR